MSNLAIAYLRSSKDRSDVSIDAQRRALYELAMSRGLSIIEEYADAVESGKDEDRPAFQRLLSDLKAPARQWGTVLVLDTSRIARRRHLALIFEHECDKRGIQIIYRNVPDSDPITGMLLKSILQAMDEWHSLTSKAKGLAGMAENVRQGWRAGGRAPRGYQLEYHPTGATRDGAPVMKSKLVPDEDAAMVARYLSGRAAGQSRGRLMATLGMDWPASSLNGLEWQALTYAGCTVWNMHNERVSGGYQGGEKRRPREEWVVAENTHDALITRDEAEAVLRQVERSRRNITRASANSYLLTGILYARDGAPWSGEWCKRMGAGLYRLGRGKKISAARVDGAVLERIEADLKSDEIAALIATKLRGTERVDGRAIAGLEKRLETLTRKVSRLVDLLTDAEPEDAPPYQRAIKDAEAERESVRQSLTDMRRTQEQHTVASAVTESDVKGMLTSLFAELRTCQDVDATKAAISGLIERIELDPASEQCRILYRIANPDTGVMMASPRGANITPVEISWTSHVTIPRKHRVA